MKKLFLLIFFLNLAFLYAQDLPQPKNNQMYTEFTSYRYAVYLKKPMLSTGFIAMNGKDRFVFKQTVPLLIEIKKVGDKISYKRGEMDPIEFTSSGDNANMPGGTSSLIFLFQDQEMIKSKYKITKNTIEGNDEFEIVPKEVEKISAITINASEDKIQKIKMLFTDKTKVVYEFKNTVTGVAPDEKLFK